ncbi:MAG: isoleucine--tRNA ligase [Pseudomonadota bacterium]
MDNLKDTLNLPQTEFPMRGNLPQREPEILAQWQGEQDYTTLRQARAGAKKFVLHCGPPYANAPLHNGHLVPNMLKDIVVRTKAMSGYDTPYIPGWDCHGLPIEWKVERGLKEQGKNKADISTADFRALCRATANEWIAHQKNDWQRMGCLGDWDQPYLTMDYVNEAGILGEMYKLAQSGLMYKAFRPVMWSTVEQTALAEAEIEYQDKESTALYFAFPIVGQDDHYLVAWTTTPWSIPSNRAVAVGADITYKGIRPQGVTATYWIAEDLAADFAKIIDADTAETIGHKPGSAFIGLESRQPLFDTPIPIVAGHHVTTDSGTGVVHIAPSHGVEDFEIGKINALDLACYVDNGGRYVAEMPVLPQTNEPLAGLSLKEAEPLILAELSTTDRLLYTHKITHSYPVSWRSKAPLIYRSTSQWFVALDKPFGKDGKTLRDIALQQIDAVNWVPEEGRNRIYGMIKDRPDWCISRQRLWGVPIALFRNKKTGDYIFDSAVFSHVTQQIAKSGIDAWTDLSTTDLLPAGWLNANGMDAADIEKETDILDVWFDSGSTYAHVVQTREGMQFPADLYLEGSDQHRGWFHSSLLLSCATNAQAPYRSVLTHGFVVDGKGKKLSKSLGNGANAGELMAKYGADILRLWVASADYKGDIKTSPEILDGVTESYRKFRNTIRYMTGNLYDFTLDQAVAYADLPDLEKAMLARFAAVQAEAQENLNSYKFYRAIQVWQNFCAVDLSSIYFDIRKDTLYCEKPNSLKRRACQTVLLHLFKGIVTALTPFMPFTADEAWRSFFGADKPIYLETFYTLPADVQDAAMLDRWNRILEIRSAVNAMVETTLRAPGHVKANSEVDVVLALPDRAAMPGEDALQEILICASVTLTDGPFTVQVSKTTAAKCPRCWNHRTVGSSGVCGRCDAATNLKSAA